MSLFQNLVIFIGASSSVLALVAAVLVIWNTNSQRVDLYRKKLESFNNQKTRIEGRLKDVKQ